MFKRPQRKSPSGKPSKAGAAREQGLRPGHRFEGEVRDLNSDGQAVVAHPGGRVFFVPGAWRGEAGLFEVTSLKGRMGFAKVVSLSKESLHRRASPCPHHGVTLSSCGGCPWLFVNYAEQLRSKEAQLHRMLQPLNEALTLSPIWASPEELGYRNRAQLKTDGKRLGYVAGSTREIVPINDCLVLNTKNRTTLRELNDQLPNSNWKPPRAKQWTTLDLDDELLASQITVNKRRPFRQGNSAQNQRMRGWLSDRINKLSSPDPVIELFAGSGNFTDVLVEAGCKRVCAVDSFRPAIETLRQRSLPGVTAVCSDLGRNGSATELEAHLADAKLLVLDPPREGLKNLGEYLAIAKTLTTIIYISCDVATLKRDLEQALTHGFKLQELQPLDLFPQTPHVEVMTLLTR